MKRFAWGLLVLLALSVDPYGFATAQTPLVDIRLHLSDSVVPFGSPIQASGRVVALGETEFVCISGVEVSILENVVDDQPVRWEKVGEVRTTQDGQFTETLLPWNSGKYRAELNLDDMTSCGGAVSPERRFHLKAKVSLRPSSRAIEPTERVRLSAVVTPTCREETTREPIELLVFRHGRFVEIASRDPGNDCAIVFKRQIARTTVFAARVGRIEDSHWLYLRGRSPQKAVGLRGN